YEAFERIFRGERFAALRAAGAAVQRPLWASTSSKNPAYRDVVYAEELIGPDTVDTMPLATIEAFADHGEVRGDTVREGHFGASGDLTRRKRVPALYELSVQGLLPAGFTVVGAARSEGTDEGFRASLRQAVERHGRLPVTDLQWASFAEGVRYARVDLDDPE